MNQDIKFLIYYHCNIEDLKSCFIVDKESLEIYHNSYFWKLYFEKHQLPLIIDDKFKSFHVNMLINKYIHEYGDDILLTCNVIVNDLFNNNDYNYLLMDYIKDYIDFYEIRIYNNIVSITGYELRYEGCVRTHCHIKADLNPNIIHYMLYKIIYHNDDYTIKKCRN